MNRATTLAQNSLARIFRFDHPSGMEHRDEAVEPSNSYAVSFVEHGSFSVVRSQESWTFQEDDVLLSYLGDCEKYHHATRTPDDVCLSVNFAPEVVEEMLGKAPRSGSPLRIPACDRTIFQQFRLKEALQSKESLAIECATLGLIPALFPEGQEWRRDLHQRGRFLHYLTKVKDAVHLLESEFDQPHSLSELAHRVAMSPFHFSRIFKGLTGSSPHQYLLELRLAYASRRLRDGAKVTATAYESGFENLSHFIRMFRRRFGVPPTIYCQRRSRAR